MNLGAAAVGIGVGVILASVREVRRGEPLARWMHALVAERPGVEAALIDLKDWPLPAYTSREPPTAAEKSYAAGSLERRWAERIGGLDAYLVVTPEYNHGYSGALKNAVDLLYASWSYKPIAYCAYGGLAGGARVVEQLRLVAVELRMVPIRDEVNLRLLGLATDDRGWPSDPLYGKRAAIMIDELLWWARLLESEPAAMNYARKVAEKKRVRLSEVDFDPPKGVDKENSKQDFERCGRELFDLQDLLWGAKTHALLVVLQGRDTAGKDGVIKHVVGNLNPRGVSVVSFGVPTEEERQHDFIWRVHRHAPRHGEVAIFNRSHYEDVLVVRVHELAPEALWRERYGHIRDFEELLVEHNTIVVKFFLHISKKEQEERLLEREKDPRAAWKLNPFDWTERELWDDYTEAYEEALERTLTLEAPWYIVPADEKWFRNLAVARALVDELRPYEKEWRAVLDERGRAGRAAIAAWRRKQKGR